MEIRIEQLRERPRQLEFAEPSGAFLLLGELAEQGVAEFRGEIRVVCVASLVGALVEVEGAVSCTLVLPCSRCLQPVEQDLTLALVLSFSRQPAGGMPFEEERELTENEVGLIPFEGDTLDLHDAIEQELVMALPLHPLCREECAGLCPVCGADLNRQRCACTPPQLHAALAALRNFKVNKA